MNRHTMLEKIDNIREKITDGEYKDLVESLAKFPMAKPDIDVDNVKYVMLRMKKTYYDWGGNSRVENYEDIL